MKSFLKCLIVLAVMVMFNTVAIQGQTVDEYIKKANNFQNSGELDQAVNTMKEATEKYPNHADAYLYLGLYIGM